MKDKKPVLYANKKVLIIIILFLILAIVGLTFAYYFTILKGENINATSMSNASVTYSEPESGINTSQLSDFNGMTSSQSYDFTVTGHAGGTTNITYAIYLSEEDGNDINPDQIKFYLTDYDDIPYENGTDITYESEIIDPETNESKPVKEVTSYTITDGSQGEKKTGQLDGKSERQVLLEYYADEVVHTNDIYIMENSDEGNECRKYINKQFDYGDEFTKETGEENCTIAWDESGKITNKEGGNTLYTITTKSKLKLGKNYSETYDGNILDYIAEKSEVDSGPIYISKGYRIKDTNNKDGSNDKIKSYCTKYTLSPKESGVNAVEDEIVDSSNCSDSYTYIIGKPNPVDLTSLDELYKEQFKDSEGEVKNIILVDDFNFNAGTLKPNPDSNQLTIKRQTSAVRNYRLRYWISQDASEVSKDTPRSEEKQEVTSNNEEKSHTVQFKTSGTFKFKVNVLVSEA